MTRWDLVYKWADPETQSLVDTVTSALENCDRKLSEAQAAALTATPPAQPLPTVEQIERALQELWRVRDSQDHFVYDIPVPPDRQTAAALHGVLSRTLGGPR